MLKCTNCGGAVKFDIQSQALRCDSCMTTFAPSDFDVNGSAEEEKEMNLTIFRCPSCGGEIASTDETAAGFCSYCGASTILESRLSKEKRPEFIIPFKRTKTQCIDTFKNRMKKALFAPGEYKNAGRVDSFRGIYMPYWLYDMSQNGNINVKTSTSHRSGDYIITDHYNLSGTVDNVYNGVSYDASSSFADDISTEIAPFNVKDIKPFSSVYLSGFYADLADVPVSVYENTAIDMAQESTYNYLKKKSPMSGESFDESKEKVKSQIKTKINYERSAMFPVWFLSYRNKDRVAYATVNGQTGRVSADIPVSIPKYLVCSLIIALVIFLILQTFLTVTPDVLIAVIAFFALISAIMYNSEMKKIVSKENYDNDLGMQDRMERKKQSRIKAQKGASFEAGIGEQEAYVMTENDIKRAKRKPGKRKGEKTFGIGALLAIVFGIGIAGPIVMAVGSVILEELGIDKVLGLISLIVLVISICLHVNSAGYIKEMKANKHFPATIFTVIGLVLTTIVSFWDPPQDIIYYTVAIIAMIGIILNIVDMMASYNYIAMRPLPQFEMYQGGDDRA